MNHATPAPVSEDTATTEATSSQKSLITTAIIVTMALLAAVAPFATDLYLPAFPSMVDELASSTAVIQLSLTAFLVGVAVGQLIFGPLSDRLGRRRPLVVGAAIFVLASVATALAPTAALLISARLAQGLAGAAGMVIGRSVIADLARGSEAARAFSALMIVGGVAPVIAPVTGSLLADVIGWRGLLWIVASIGVIALISILMVVPETHKPTARLPADARPSLLATLRPLSSRQYLGATLGFAFSFSTMMAYISASPFLYQITLGFDSVQYGLAFGLNALVLMATSALAMRLTTRLGVRRIARIGLSFNLGAIVVLTGLVAFGAPSLTFALPILVAVGALGLVFGTTTAMALEAAPAVAGTASAFLGFAQFALAGLAAPLVGLGGANTVVPLAVTMLVGSMVASAVFSLTRPSTDDTESLSDAEVESLLATPDAPVTPDAHIRSI